MTDLTKVQQTLVTAGVPMAQLKTLAPQVQKNAEALRAQENVRKFGDLVARSEGTVANPWGIADPYRVGFGGSEIKDMSAHPAKSVQFNELSKDGKVGKVNSTTAAGKYQFLKPTWDALSKRTGVTDFTPASQERNFVELLKDNKVLKAVESGDFLTAIDKLGKRNQFASFPTAKANQPKHTPEKFAQMAKASGIDLGAVVSGQNQPLTEVNIVDGLLPTQQQMAAQQAEEANNQAIAMQAEADAMAAQEQQAIAQQAAQEQQMIAQEKQAKIDKIGSMLYDNSLGNVGKNPMISTKYDKELLAIIDAA
jgi:muramidase (phage lysozyme)